MGKAVKAASGGVREGGGHSTQAKTMPVKPKQPRQSRKPAQKRVTTETLGNRQRRLSRAERNIAWIEQYCVIPEGKLVGKPVRLTPIQKDWLRKIYDTPTRTFILSMARKNAKTALSAFLLLLHLCGPEARANSQLYSAAQSRDQAAILFELAAKIVRQSPMLDAVVAIRDTAKQLHCADLGTLYKALSAEATTAYGLSPVFVVHDELGQVKGPRSELYEALESAQQAHDDPLTIIISTQAPTEADLLSILIDDAISGADPRVKVVLHTAPLDAPPFDEDTIRMANPHYDDFINQTEVMRQASEAQRMPSRESSYRNLILNQRVEANNPFVSRQIWIDNGDMQSGGWEGRDVYCGLDLSSVHDLTALTIMAPSDGVWDVYSKFWLPAEGLIEKARADRVPYDIWANDGFLDTIPGKSIEYEFIAVFLRDLFDKCNVRAIGFDRWNFRFLKPWLEKAGFSQWEIEKFVEFGQGFVSMSPALRELESLLLNKKIRHGMHPVLTMCAANAVVVTDAAENRKFVKNKSSGRIDGMVSLSMAVGVAPAQVEEVASVYEMGVI